MRKRPFGQVAIMACGLDAPAEGWLRAERERVEVWLCATELTCRPACLPACLSAVCRVLSRSLALTDFLMRVAGVALVCRSEVDSLSCRRRRVLLMLMLMLMLMFLR